MITIISGPSGTGKTLAALRFAQEPGTLYFVGDEVKGTVLVRTAEQIGLDVSKTVFITNTWNASDIWHTAKEYLSKGQVQRMVVEDANGLVDFGFGEVKFLLELSCKYGVQILVTTQTRSTPEFMAAVIKKVEQNGSDVWPSLRYAASYHIQLTGMVDGKPAGVLRKSRDENRAQELSELFGITLIDTPVPVPQPRDPVVEPPDESDYGDPLHRINDVKSSLCVAVETLVEHYGDDTLALVSRDLLEDDAVEMAEEVWGKDSDTYQKLVALYTKNSPSRGQRLTVRDVLALKPGDKVWVRYIERHSDDFRLDEMDEVVSVESPGVLSLSCGSYRDRVGEYEGLDSLSADTTDGWCALYRVDNLK